MVYLLLLGCLMPRKGWSWWDVPSGWVHTIREPAPKSRAVAKGVFAASSPASGRSTATIREEAAPRKPVVDRVLFIPFFFFAQSRCREVGEFQKQIDATSCLREGFADNFPNLTMVPCRSTRIGRLDQQSEREFGDAPSISKIGTLLSQGALLASQFHDRSGCEAPVCGSEFSLCASFQGRESGVRDARYGLRGTRVGEGHSLDDNMDDLECRLGRDRF